MLFSVSDEYMLITTDCYTKLLKAHPFSRFHHIRRISPNKLIIKQNKNRNQISIMVEAAISACFLASSIT